MNATATATILNKEDLLAHWQGHRNLTRRVIEAFPEKDFFEFSIAGMRTFAQLTTEILSMGAPAMKAIVERDDQPYTEKGFEHTSKAKYLEQWDASTEQINHYWAQLSPEDFGASFNLFAQYNFPTIQNIMYLIDNEIHHRGQGTVYLRALGIEPPFFWER